jgi:hypothetical protein
MLVDNAAGNLYNIVCRVVNQHTISNLKQVAQGSWTKFSVVFDIKTVKYISNPFEYGKQRIPPI